MLLILAALNLERCIFLVICTLNPNPMSDIVQAADDFILHLFKEKLPNTFTYHNYTHSKRVYKSINEIIENSEVSDTDATVLRLAALLHDTGYIHTREGHEEESVKIATKFLEEQGVSEEIIEGVKKCIMATKFKDTPNNALEEMIRDADASHFGKDYFFNCLPPSMFLCVFNHYPDPFHDDDVKIKKNDFDKVES